MTLLNLNVADKLYYGDIEADKLYYEDQQIYPVISTTDPFLADTLLWLRGDDFADSSSFSRGIIQGSGSAINSDFKYGSGSLDFNNANSSIQVNNVAGLTSLTNISVEAWVKLFGTNTSGNGLLQWNGRTSNNLTNNIITLNYQSPTRILVNNNFFNIPYSFNQWFHLALVYLPSSVQIYVDGILRATVGSAGIALNTSNTLQIGAYFNGISAQLGGLVDSFRITNAVRYTGNFDPEIDTYLAY